MRRLGFGLSTLLGLRPLGFFIPYRYAVGVRPCGHPALADLFQAAEPTFRDVLTAIEAHGPFLLAIRDGPGPARFDQDWFPRLDAAAAYAIVRREKPALAIEIGSGHSTRFLARALADEGPAGGAGRLLAIDPAPRAALARLGVRHEAKRLEEIDPASFPPLGASDILFVDSSHIAMPGTDLDRIVGGILPRLPAGTLVHLHDIFLPDPYPADWAWRGYNEATVAAALIGSGGYDLLFSSHWVATRRPAWLEAGVLRDIPLRPGARETSLWLRKR